jgi:hypothetical protein
LTTQSALAFLCETVTSPRLISTAHRVGRFAPFEMSKRRMPSAFSSAGSCPRCASPRKNSVVASVVPGAAEALTWSFHLQIGARSNPAREALT